VESNFNHLLTVAYFAMGFVALIGYIPQMRAFWTRPELCAATPLLTWSLWSSQTVVFFLYAVVANGDRLFMFNTFMFMCATITCLAMIVRGRKLLKQRKKAMPHNVVMLKAA
jgi:hypothetical protein